MCNPRFHPDSYTAVKLWLQILKEYDDNYFRENIANFKTRYIQQQALSGKPSNPGSPEKVMSHMPIDENEFIRPSEPGENKSETRKYDRLEADMHAMGLQIIVETEETRTNLDEEFEYLTDTLNDFVDMDDNRIDFIK